MDFNEYKSKLPPFYGQKDLEFLKKAFAFAKEKHEGQKRINGKDYITHPVEVSLMAAELKTDKESVAAALLHDTVEESDATIKDIKKNFGNDVSRLVQGLTKVDKIQYKGAERSAESMRKMFMAIAQDVRVIIIKLLDRMNNLETLEVFPETKRERIALETLEIYAPIADRLGMGEIKARLEDTAFKHAYPKEYDWILKETREKITERENYLKKITPIFEEKLRQEKLNIISLHFRAKHYYSLWKKLLRYGMDWYLIYDLMAVRIIVKTVEECYAVMGIIHKHWKPLPGRIKDYIALPKQQGYKSLHTTVFGPEEKIVEFQIRTPEMHEEAEYGIAAHWAWEIAGKPTHTKNMPNQKFYWVKQLSDWQKSFKKETDSKQFLQSLKIDFFQDRVFVLTPKGDVIDLPEGATPIDFAYHIHSDIGNSMVSAKINNRIVPLSHELISGDMVEIITQKNKKPSAKWLDIAKTAVAKHHIKNALKKEGVFKLLPEIKSSGIKCKIAIINIDRIGMIRDVTNIFTSSKINIEKMVSRKLDKRNSTISAIFQAKNKEQAQKIITAIKQIDGVEEVRLETTKNI
jgi:GTP pyrophosphokinase